MKRFALFAVVFLFGGIFSATAQDSDPAAGFIAEAEQAANAQDSDPVAGFIAEGGGRPIYALDPEKLNFGISLNPAGFIPFVGNGLSLSLDFTKGKFNSKIDIHSGFGVLWTQMFSYSEHFGISANFHYFHPSRIGGFYAGVMLEYSFGRYDIKHGLDYDFEEQGYGDGYDDEGNYYSGVKYVLRHQFGFAGSAGYKFVTTSGVYFRTGAAVGFSFPHDLTFRRRDIGLLVRPDLSVGYNFGKKRR